MATEPPRADTGRHIEIVTRFVGKTIPINCCVESIHGGYVGEGRDRQWRDVVTLRLPDGTLVETDHSVLPGAGGLDARTLSG